MDALRTNKNSVASHTACVGNAQKVIFFGFVILGRASGERGEALKFLLIGCILQIQMEQRDVKENIAGVLSQIRCAEKNAGRAEGGVKLLAVSKFHPVHQIEEAISAGQLCFGENRVQEAVVKFPEILKKNKDVHLHIIGQLQTNKVKKAVEIASCIESVDRMPLLMEIERQCAKMGKTIEVLFELHTAEDSKSGFENLAALEEAVKFIVEGNAPHITPKGFMTLAPFTDDEEKIRRSFKTLKNASRVLNEKYSNFNMTELSMGMSGDYKIAIEEGSTEVRIGTAIFGERNYSNTGPLEK